MPNTILDFETSIGSGFRFLSVAIIFEIGITYKIFIKSLCAN